MSESREQFYRSLQEGLIEYEPELPPRILGLIQKVVKEKNESEDFFRILVRLLYKADQQPVELLSDLLTIIQPDSMCMLENSTVSRTAVFIRDYLKREQLTNF